MCHPPHDLAPPVGEGTVVREGAVSEGVLLVREGAVSEGGCC